MVLQSDEVKGQRDCAMYQAGRSDLVRSLLFLFQPSKVMAVIGLGVAPSHYSRILPQPTLCAVVPRQAT